MKAKKIAATGLAAAMSMAVLAGCGPKSEAATTTTVTIAFDADMSSWITRLRQMVLPSRCK